MVRPGLVLSAVACVLTEQTSEAIVASRAKLSLVSRVDNERETSFENTFQSRTLFRIIYRYAGRRAARANNIPRIVEWRPRTPGGQFPRRRGPSNGLATRTRRAAPFGRLDVIATPRVKYIV